MASPKSCSLASLLLLLAWPGTAATQTASLVHDINRNPVTNPSSLPLHGFLFGGSAYFFASTTVTGRELYRTDGTAAGTFVVDLDPGASWSSSDPVGVLSASRHLRFAEVVPGSDGIRFAVMGGVAGAAGFDSTATTLGTFGD